MDVIDQFRRLFGRSRAEDPGPLGEPAPIDQSGLPFASITDAGSATEAARTAVRNGHMRGLFSQLGEDGTILWLFEGKKDGFYVDIGCHSPTVYSNTAALHFWHGWHGINFDIDKRSIVEFDKWRPNDTNLNVGVAPEAGTLDAYIFDSGALSTLDQSTAGSPAWAHVPRTKTTIEVHPLRDLLDRHLPAGQDIDFMNIDAEGLDHSILLSNDWTRYRPGAIAVEAHGFDPGRPADNPTFQLLTSLGYCLVSHVVVTSIYRRI